jgi:hypothetical protein
VPASGASTYAKNFEVEAAFWQYLSEHLFALAVELLLDFHRLPVPTQNCELTKEIEEFPAPPPYHRGA